MDLREQFLRQLSFLERSAQSYDAGYEDEAIRIALSIRVLVHDTQRSTSLLTLLNAKGICLVSTARNDVDFAAVFFYVGLGTATLRPGGKTQGFRPNFAETPTRINLPIERWWDQVVFVTGEHQIRRRDIVLTAANKDGGAHVDPKLTADCEALLKLREICNLPPELFVMPDVLTIIKETRNLHFVCLRQMAYELLSSAELLALKH